MAYLSALDQLLSVRNGVWGIFALFVLGMWRAWTGLPAVMQQWIAHRKSVAAEKDSEWKRLRDEVSRLSGSHDECQRLLADEREARHLAVTELRDELAAERSERMKLQAIIDGQGEVRQAAASAAAEIRIDDADKKRREK